MRGGRGLGAWLAGMVLLAGCGDADVASDDPPCSEVVASLEEPQRVRAETFGGGPEGREAMATIASTVEARADCFSSEEVRLGRDLSELMPTDA